MTFKKNLRSEGCVKFQPVGGDIGIGVCKRLNSSRLHYPRKVTEMRTRISRLFPLMLCALAGCRTTPPLSPVNLKETGWMVRQGQAVWRSSRTAPEIAGEVLLATRTNDEAFVQFIKTPFPLVTAQKDADAWQVELPTENKRYSGRGRPPARLIWFWLARVVCGEPAPQKWIWNQDHGRWRLENRATGEALEGYFAEALLK